ncbi:MerR family DNA-binding transcriptional regulator [Actinoplanes sp. TRM 88003]|uniref:MerR family DNA-binding transcriptional regulator n=1 Tax=Paractinoplanes aksuensis TaxID=2939490 RepID=A0ABT1DJT9_9ACTN|nr:MerR family DNA-binding transcriptional regulator [Actinoplanes aksuensis]MCO8271065.1 MerR family DNA-binding transcriptional regulator [Actinoplanes aksuensis]
MTHSFVMPPRLVKIGDAAVFAGTTPRAIRHYHQIGLLPEPERGGAGTVAGATATTT